MKKQYKARLRTNHTFLLENLIVDELVTIMWSERKAFSNDDRKRVQDEKIQLEKINKFCNILMCKASDKVYEDFLEVLCDPRVDQKFIRDKLETTDISDQFQEDAEEEQRLEQIIKECFVEAESTECSKEDFINIIRIQFRRQQKSLSQPEAVIFHIAGTVFPKCALKRHKKRVVSIQNIHVKPEILQTINTCHDGNANTNESIESTPLEDKPPSIVAIVLRTHLENMGLDKSLSEKFEEEEIDGQSLSELKEETIKELFPKMSVGKRVKVMKAVRSTLEDLMKPSVVVSIEKDVSPRRRETYRQFDMPPSDIDVYDQGYVLPAETPRPGFLLNPIHRYCIFQMKESESFAREIAIFAAACMNERVNGTIHFGVASKRNACHEYQNGEIVGLQIDKHWCEVESTKAVYKYFYPDQREMALSCIRNPVFIPVTVKKSASEMLYVVEIDVVPSSDVVLNEAFYLTSVLDRPTLFRYFDGNPQTIEGKKLDDFFDHKDKLTNNRRDSERATYAPPDQRPDLHRKLHNLLTCEHEYKDVDIFRLLLLSPCTSEMTKEYLQLNFGCIKSLDPMAIFDFEPQVQECSESSKRIYSVLDEHFGEVYRVLTTDDFDETGGKKVLDTIRESFFKTWIFCNGLESLQKEELQPAAWRSQRGHGFKEAVRFYRTQFQAKKVRFLVFLLSRNYDVVLGALEEIFTAFPEQWIIIAESEKIAKTLMSEVVRRNYVEKRVLEERCVIGMMWSHVNDSIMKIFGDKARKGTVTRLPTSSGSGGVMMKEQIKNELPDLEILSMDQCNADVDMGQITESDLEKLQMQSEEDYYRGYQVSWWNFYFKDHVMERDQFKELRDLAVDMLNGKLPEDEKVGVITLFHQLGAGGTTIARQVLWEMKSKYRCCVLNKVTDDTFEQIARLRSFEERDFPKPPLVLIDNEDEDKVSQLCSYMNEKARREARDSKSAHMVFCVLIVCIRIHTLPSKKDNLVTLGHELQEVEILWFRRRYRELEARYQQEKKGMHPKLLISFNILKENFNPAYIEHTVDHFITGITNVKERQLLKFIALINTFDLSFRPIPTCCFDVIMTSSGSASASAAEHTMPVKGDTQWETNLSESLKVLLNRTSRTFLGGNIKAVKIINSNLSSKILENLRNREKVQISDVMLELLMSRVFTKDDSSVQSNLNKIIRDVLRKRGVNEKGRAKFSPIINAIEQTEGFEKAAEVLIVGFEHSDDPLIAQQIARVYIQCQNWEKARKFAKIAMQIQPRNSFLCDTYGQVYKQELIAVLNKCLVDEENLEGQAAKHTIAMAFEAIDIFRKEQNLTDETYSSEYNNCGFFSELRVIATILDLCRFLKPFREDDGKCLRRFLIEEQFVPHDLLMELGNESIQKLKRLYHEYEKPMRRLEDEQIQLKEDPCYQFCPGFSNSMMNRHSLVNMQEWLNTYFGEDSDRVPDCLTDSEACEYRQRRVKRIGGKSLFSIYELRDSKESARTYERMFNMIKLNVESQFRSAFDFVTIVNVVLARNSLDKAWIQHLSIRQILKWTTQLYEMTKSGSKDQRPFLESYLYLVMFHWPTEWRKQQKLPLCSCYTINEAIKQWKLAFQNNHPAQKETEGRKPDRRKATTLFFLGQGEGFDEIVYFEELGQGKKVGDVWVTSKAKEKLKQLKGILRKGGKEMQVTIVSENGSSTHLEIPTSFPINDQSMWQKSVHFVLGFCWSGPKAYDVKKERIESTHTSTEMKRGVNARGGAVSQLTHGSLFKPMVGNQFWLQYTMKKNALEELEINIRFCSDQEKVKDLQKRKNQLEKERAELIQLRTDVLQGTD